MTRLLVLSDLHLHTEPNRVGWADMLADLRAASFAEKVRILGETYPVSSYDPVLADAAKAFAVAQKDSLDAILITGDLATTGSADDMALAWNWCDALSKATGLPVAVMPGNHDRFGPLDQLYPPGDGAFDRAFPAWTCKQGVGVLWSDEQVCVIAADFSLVPGDVGDEPLVGHLGRGRARESLVLDLFNKTWAPKSINGKSLLWAIHFEPGASDSTLALLDEQLLAAGVASSPGSLPLACLTGHTHLASVERYWNGLRLFSCGSTCQHSQSQGNWLNMVEVADGAASLRRFKFNGTVFAEQSP